MKTVLITGGSRGIGSAMVRLFSSHGYKVAFTYRSSDEAAMALARECSAVAIKADSECPQQISFAVERAEAEIGDIEILLNNAAVSSISLISDVSLEEWNRVMNTCVTGAFLYTKCVLSKMINKKRGRIINISSMWGNVGASCEVHYSTAKAALNGFTKALAKELGPSGITVNAIAPGLIKTDMNAALDEQTLAGICDDTPMGRIGLPDDVAEAALFLASEKASFITGEIMNVSGGYVV